MAASSAAQPTPSRNRIKQSDSSPATPSQSSSSSDGIAAGQSIAPGSSAGFLQDLDFPFTSDGGDGANIGSGDDATNQASLWNFATPGGTSTSFPFLGSSQLDGQADSLANLSHDLGGGMTDANNASINALFPNSYNSGSTPQSADLQAGSSMLSTSRPSGSQLPTHVAKNNPFLNKLRSMVDDPKTDNLIRWSEDGETFLVPNHVRFGDEVLPRFFKHNRFSSFVRQLNMYGFHKVPHLQQGALKSEPGQETELWEFRNENFKRDRPELLLQMQRKKGVRIEDEGRESNGGKGKGQGPDMLDGNGVVNAGGATSGQVTLDAINGALTRAQRGEGDAGMLQLASVWSAIQAIQSAQQGINDNLRHLHNTNNELWREAAEQRSRSKKQEETINKMLRFLAGIFGAQDVNNIGTSDHHRRSDSSTPSSASSTQRNSLTRTYNKGRRRLLLGDGSTPGGQIEELEVPLDEDEEEIDEEPTPQGRITEARSGSNSPATHDSPTMKLNDLPNTPNNKKQGSTTRLPFVPSDAASTPGGGRRISQQAGAQLLNALASGEAQSWLANMLGQPQSQAGSGGASQSARTRNDNLNSAATGNNSFKLDAQTLAALQGILTAGGAGGDPSSMAGAHSGGYFDGAPRTDGTQSGNAAPSWASGALSPRPSVNLPADQAQLTRLAPQQQQLQNITQDASAVQNVLNALVQGLRLENNGLNNVAQNNGAPLSNQGQAGASETNAIPSSSSTAATQGPVPPPVGEVDMDSLLKEFFHDPSSDGISSDSTPTGNGLQDTFAGETPSFAFSPGPTTAAAGTESGHASTTQSGASSSNNSPPHPTHPTGSRKRKPDDDDDQDALHASSASRVPGNKAKTTRQGSK